MKKRSNRPLAAIFILALLSGGLAWYSERVPGFLGGLGHILAALAGLWLVVALCASRYILVHKDASRQERSLAMLARCLLLWSIAAPAACLLLHPEGEIVVAVLRSLFALSALLGLLLWLPLRRNSETPWIRHAAGAAMIFLGIVMSLFVSF